MGLLRKTAQLAGLSPSGGSTEEGFAVPFQFLFTGEDSLRLVVSNVAPGITLRVAGRWLNPDDQHVEALVWDFVPASIGGLEKFDIPLPRGYLLNLMVRPLQANVHRGQCYLRVDVIRGRDATVTLGTLMAGYVISLGGRAWPGSILEGPHDGPGWIHTVSGAVPVPPGAAVIQSTIASAWRVQSILCGLTTDAAVGMREPYCALYESGLARHYSLSSCKQAAGTTVTHCWAPGLNEALGTNGSIGRGALPTPLLLRSDGSIVTMLAVGAFGVGGPMDAFSGVQAVVEEWRNLMASIGG